MRPHALRYATALAAIAIFLSAAIAGIVTALDGLRDLVAAVPTDASFQRWSLDPALASLARDLPSEGAEAGGDEQGRANVLARRPLSSINWLRLARDQLADGRDPVVIVPTFVMSILTGPDEGYVMAQRGLVGIMLWEKLPRDVRSHVAGDITGAFIPLTQAEKDDYRNALNGKSEAVRGEIRDALVTARLFPAALERIGL
jgi:hypothetical protein